MNLLFYYCGEENYYLKINIPRIALNKNVYTINSIFNDVDFNVELLNESNSDENLFFLASHSGNGNANYFNKIFLLEKGDFIYIYKFGERLCFKVDEKFYINKNGYFNIDYQNVKNNLFLVTCSLKYPTKQFIVKSILFKC